MSKAELKPCPFCGSHDIALHAARKKSMMLCLNCGCRGPGIEVRFNIEPVIDCWNSRAEPDKAKGG